MLFRSIGEERYDLFEYYRLMRNAFVHGPISKAKLAEHFAAVEPHRGLVASQYGLDAPNAFEKVKLDDYMLFTRLIKYIATDVCPIGEPSDQALVNLIKWCCRKLVRRAVSSGSRPSVRILFCGMGESDPTKSASVLPAVYRCGKKTSAHVFEGLPASGRGSVLDNTAGSPPVSCGLPARVRSER